MLSPIITVFMYYPIKTLINFAVIFGIALFEFCRLRRLCKNNSITKRYGIAKWLLVFYIECLYFLSVFGRRSWSYYRYHFDVGWSYRYCIETGDVSTLNEILINIIIFIPVGFLAAYLVKKGKLLKPLFLGLIITISIECLQLVMRTGCFEFDDMINNVAGVCIGALPVAGYYYFLKLKNRLNKAKSDGN